MALTIYKISEYVNWAAKGGATYISGGGGVGEPYTPVDLSNYYTKTELQVPGSSIIDFANIVNFEGADNLWEADSMNTVQLIDEEQYLYTAGIAFIVGYLLSDQGSFIDMGIVDQLTLYAPVILLSDGHTGCLPQADSSAEYVVMYDPATGQLSYGEGGGEGGVTPVANILDWSEANSWYAPYSARAAGRLYSGTALPTNTNRLNYDGYFYATRMYANDVMYANDFILNSDRRLKVYIKSYKSEELMIDYKQFALKSDIRQLRFGVIAQELQKLYPELVREDENGNLAVSYIDLLVREIVNLKDRIRDLENK